MNFIKKHKLLTIFLSLVLVFIILILLLLKQLLGGGSNNLYGNRLAGIDKVKITSEESKKIKTEISNEENVTKVTYRLKGRLINLVIEFKDETELDKAKEIGNKVLTYFDEKQLSYYDIQVFINSDKKESEKYPIIGYKHKIREAINWD